MELAEFLFHPIIRQPFPPPLHLLFGDNPPATGCEKRFRRDARFEVQPGQASSSRLRLQFRQQPTANAPSLVQVMDVEAVNLTPLEQFAEAQHLPLLFGHQGPTVLLFALPAGRVQCGLGGPGGPLGRGVIGGIDRVNRVVIDRGDLTGIGGRGGAKVHVGRIPPDFPPRNSPGQLSFAPARH